MNRKKQKKDQIQRIAVAVFAIGLILYLLQIASPLRLVTDSVRYLALADSAYSGNGFHYMGSQDQFPLGYPTIILFLLKLGLAKSAIFILINIFCIFLGLHLLVSQWIFLKDDRLAVFTVVFFTIFSWCTIKHTTIPLTEYIYFLISVVTLALTQNTLITKNKLLWFSLGAFSLAFALLAISLRTIGIVLLPTIILSYLVSIGRTVDFQEWKDYLKPKFFLFLIPPLLLVSLILLALGQTEWFSSQFLRENGYFWSMLTIFTENGLPSTIGKIFYFRSEEITQIVLNFPKSKLPLPEGVYLFIGMICWTLIFWGALLLFRYSETITIYFFSYTFVMLWWPYNDPRFWIPVLPIIGLALLLAIRTGLAKLSTPYLSFCKKTLLGFALCYVVLGFAALLYSSKLTYSGENFGNLYGEGARAPVYNSFLKCDTANSESKQTELELHILERYQ